MKNRLFTILFLIPCFSFACAKKGIQIGHEHPEIEIEKCLKLSKKKAYDEAIECYEIFKSRFANTPYAQDAALRIADSHFQKKDYLLAADAYLDFVKIYPLHPKSDYAYYRAGLSYLKEAPKPIDRDQKNLEKAKEQLEIAKRHAFQGEYRSAIEEALTETNRRLAERTYYIGRFYYRTGEYLAAVARLEELNQNFPESPKIPKSLYLLTKSHLKLGDKDRARETVEKMGFNYPKDPWTKKAQNTYEEKTK